MKIPRKSLRIGLVHPDSFFWTLFHYHALAWTKQIGCLWFNRSVRSPLEQIAELERFVSENLDIVLFPQMTSLYDGLEVLQANAQARNVTLVALDGAPGGEIWFDNSRAQAAVMEYVCERLNGKGKIAHLQGDLTWDAGIQRNAGLHSVLPRYPNIELAFESPTDWCTHTPSRTQGTKLAREALDAHPDLSAIISSSDETAMGVVDAVEERGLQGKVLITGFDAVPEALVAIADRRIEVSVLQPIHVMVENAIKIGLSRFNGEKSNTTPVVQEITVVTKENVGDIALVALRFFTEVTRELSNHRDEQVREATFLQTLLDNMPTMLVVKDARDLRYIRINKAQEEWLATRHGEQIGKTVHDFYPEEMAERSDESDIQTLSSGIVSEVYSAERSLSDGALRYSHTRKIPIFDFDGRAAYLMCISEDITARRLAEEQVALHATELERTNRMLQENQKKLVASEKMAALGSLVAGVAHELNTPIGNSMMVASTLVDITKQISDTYVRGITRSALENYFSETSNGALLIERNLRKAADLISSFKQFAIDQTSSKSRKFALAEVVSETILALWPTIKKMPFEVKQDIPDDIVMDSYPGPVGQILMNLINNALIHGLEGRRQGLVHISAKHTEPDCVELIVEDNGVGIPEENLKRIYDPFFSTKFGMGGSGLGLSITYNLVTNLLGGHIEAESTVGVGTRFCVIMPLCSKIDLV